MFNQGQRLTRLDELYQLCVVPAVSKGGGPGRELEKSVTLPEVLRRLASICSAYTSPKFAHPYCYCN